MTRVCPHRVPVVCYCPWCSDGAERRMAYLGAVYRFRWYLEAWRRVEGLARRRIEQEAPSPIYMTTL